ncbi:hypothetical protein [Neorhizobium galegae]|uniref:hypothetical protein n=1 Tax=Neorhizobium galegae TaxID=399 RepID=UPI0020C7965F|nr:hypothetical protein [Neorhizobium galegae]
MPHTFNADRRDKIAKQKYQVTNWPAYNESLRQRGDLTIWVKDEGVVTLFECGQVRPSLRFSGRPWVLSR